MSNINTIHEDDEVLFEPTPEEKREMSRKYREEKAAKAKKSKILDVGPPLIKKKFRVNDLKKVHPKTENQRKVFESYKQFVELNHILIGSAGTGKTFLGMALGIEDVLDPSTPYERMIILRSPRETGPEMGFLPGTVEEKMAQYEKPYIAICNQLFDGKEKPYESLKELGLIEFEPTAFMRGQSLDNAIILVDEIQNMNFGELNTIITRVGYNSKIIFAGDFRQNDILGKRHETSGFYPFIDIVRRMKNDFGIFEFGHNDIVRSGLVKSWIIQSEKFFEEQAQD